jgi:hypothetical protein
LPALAATVALDYDFPMALEISDLDTLKDTALKNFEARVSSPGLSKPSEIELEGARLESQLEQLYSFTALLARREPDMARTAELWATLVKACDLFAGRIFSLAQQHDLSISAYDRILDIRAAADELRALHSP